MKDEEIKTAFDFELIVISSGQFTEEEIREKIVNAFKNQEYDFKIGISCIKSKENEEKQTIY